MLGPEPADAKSPDEGENSLSVSVPARVHERRVHANQTGQPATSRIISRHHQSYVADNLWGQCPAALSHGVLAVYLRTCDAIVSGGATFEVEPALKIDLHQRAHVSFLSLEQLI